MLPRIAMREAERQEWRHRDNVVDHVMCLKAEFLSHTVLSNENGELYTTMIDIRT